MAYNVFYTSVPVLVSVIDKDLSETTVMQHPQILFYCQAGRYALTNFVYKSALFHRLMHISVYSLFFFNPGFSIQAHLRGGLVDPFFT